MGVLMDTDAALPHSSRDGGPDPGCVEIIDIFCTIWSDGLKTSGAAGQLIRALSQTGEKKSTQIAYRWRLDSSM